MYSCIMAFEFPLLQVCVAAQDFHCKNWWVATDITCIGGRITYFESFLLQVWAVATRFSALAKLAPDVFKSSECANGKPDTEVGTLRKLEREFKSSVLTSLLCDLDPV